ncbi:MAG: arginine--tRNA ligase [bacterium]|nr:MAG: arginine--tRNA ligase [bacterium]
MKGTLTEIINAALEEARKDGLVPAGELPAPIIELTRDRKYGDYATNVAMVLASRSAGNPRKIAEIIAKKILDVDREENIDRVETAGPGFINLTMKGRFWERAVKTVLQEGGDYAKGAVGLGRRIQVEFVSANPTGPLHVGHGRGAAIGDALANVLAAAGYEVEREYYINDAGNQIQTLGRSVFARYLELFGKSAPFPEDGYQGEYIIRIAENLREEFGDRYLEGDREESMDEIARYAANEILRDIRDDLEDFGVRFDVWFSESALVRSDEVSLALDELGRAGHLYREGGAVWFRSTAMDDDKDRVVVKADGSLTYFASDIAYHRNKFSRGFDRIINIWGADHHGYVARMKAGVMALGRNREDLAVLLVQLVNLKRHGQPVAMSTRAGEFVTLKEVREEVGRDAARFIFLTRKADSKLDFDLDLAKEQSNDNPVFYVQYAHARICSIIRNAEQQGIPVPGVESVDLSRLTLPEERELVRHLASLPDVVEGAALAMEPHRISIFLREISTTLHNYYYHHRVLADDRELTAARLALMIAVRTAVAKALSLLGVSAPERM